MSMHSHSQVNHINPFSDYKENIYHNLNVCISVNSLMFYSMVFTINSNQIILSNTRNSPHLPIKKISVIISRNYLQHQKLMHIMDGGTIHNINSVIPLLHLLIFYKMKIFQERNHFILFWIIFNDYCKYKAL